MWSGAAVTRRKRSRRSKAVAIRSNSSKEAMQLSP